MNEATFKETISTSEGKREVWQCANCGEDMIAKLEQQQKICRNCVKPQRLIK